MRINFSIILTAILMHSALLPEPARAQGSFYDLSSIQKIEIQFSQSNWDYQMDTAMYGSEGYVVADWVKINGVQFNTVGVKYKGNSSYDSASAKNPLHIELDSYINQSYQGYKDIKLGNGYADPSMIREVLAYSILGNYMDCPKSNFAQVYINGEYYGVYSNDESINKKFCSDHFYSNDHTFIKCNPTVNPGVTTKCNLKYIPNGDSTSYFNYYELKSDYGWNELVRLCDTVTNYSANLSTNLDMDRVLWMLAFNNVLVNLDSYTGAFAQNYYLYKDNTGRFNPIVWDLNMCFGGFPFAGSSNTSLGTLTIANMQQLPLTLHSSDNYWPLIKDIMNTPSYKKMYVAHMRTIVSEIISNNTYQTLASQLQTQIDTAVFSDTKKFYTYTDFQGAMTSNISVGSYSVPGISNLMTARNTYLQATIDFNYIPPTITNINTSVSNPSINSSFYFTATVSNTNSVYVGYRSSLSDAFVRYPMYDDGAHADGVAGDLIYGAGATMSASSMQYYIYAENTTAGMFSPQRAEHEFYTITSAPVPVFGQVVINEFLADNSSDTRNEYNIYEDWIELYNTTNNSLDVSGLYLSDEYSNPTKFAFPQGFSIQPHGYLIIWADQLATTSGYIHANFKLSNNGEQIMLSNVFGAVLDSLSYGNQLQDVSLGRCPNGTGSIVELPYPTFLTNNCATTGLSENESTEGLITFPNPASNIVGMATNLNGENTIYVYDALGQLVFRSPIHTNIGINVSNWASGVYTVRLQNMNKKIIITH